MVALFGMLSLAAGCREDDKNAGPAPLTIVTDIDVTTERGTFRVTRGSQELGCSGGTFFTRHLGQDEVSTLQMVLTCTEGERSGSFSSALRICNAGTSRAGRVTSPESEAKAKAS